LPSSEIRVAHRRVEIEGGLFNALEALQVECPVAHEVRPPTARMRGQRSDRVERMQGTVDGEAHAVADGQRWQEGQDQVGTGAYPIDPQGLTGVRLALDEA
jgi:hypothetical protein